MTQGSWLDAFTRLFAKFKWIFLTWQQCLFSALSISFFETEKGPMTYYLINNRYKQDDLYLKDILPFFSYSFY